MGAPGHELALERLRAAASGEGFDPNDASWVAPLEAAFADDLLTGHPNRAWKEWRRLFPDRRDIYDWLKNEWMDPKKDKEWRQAPPPRPSGATARRMAPAELEMMRLGVCEYCPPGPLGVYVNNSPVPKGGGAGRVAADGKVLKENEDIESFKGQTVKDLAAWLRPGGVLWKGGLTKMFWQFSARAAQRKLMQFWSAPGPGRTMRWCAMVMGWPGSCGHAQKIMLAISSFLREELGINMYSYMDEYLGQSSSIAMASLEAMMTKLVFQLLGLVHNFKKSSTADFGTKEEFIGIAIDTVPMTLQPSVARLTSIRECAHEISHRYRGRLPVSAVDWRSLVGKIRSCLRLHQQAGYKSIRMSSVLGQCTRRLGHRFPASSAVPYDAVRWCLKELDYWARPRPASEWRFANVAGGPTRSIADASCYGHAFQLIDPPIGLIHVGYFSGGGRESLFHDTMEAMAIEIGMDSFLLTKHAPHSTATHPSKHMHGCDNTPTVYAFNGNRTKSLQLAKTLSRLTKKTHLAKMSLELQYVNKAMMDGEFMVDLAGRQLSSQWDWGLHQELFNWVLGRLDLAQDRPRVDLFTTFNVRKSDRFVSRGGGPRALWQDAMTQSWSHEKNQLISSTDLLVIFPPPTLLTSVLQKIRDEALTSVLVIAPVFSKPWIEDLMSLMDQPGVFFPGGTQCLAPPGGLEIAGQQDHHNWSWFAGTLSARPEGCKDTETLSRSQQPLNTGRRETVEVVSTILGGSVGSLGYRAKQLETRSLLL